MPGRTKVPGVAELKQQLAGRLKNAAKALTVRLPQDPVTAGIPWGRRMVMLVSRREFLKLMLN